MKSTKSITTYAARGALASMILLAGCGGAKEDAEVACPISTSGFKWESSAPLISAASDASHEVLAVKDPSVVYFENEWHVYASSVSTAGEYNMAYRHFSNWSEAGSAKPYYLDKTPGLSGYHTAPQVFYFAAQKKWYLIYQSQPPQYSTTDDLRKPETWTAPTSFFPDKPASVVEQWIDFWVISDGTNFYLFFTGDDGRFYRSQTSNQSFPNGFSDPVIVMQTVDTFSLFEAGHIYRMKGSGSYVAIIEAIGQHRYFRSFTTDRLDGEWTPLAGSWSNPFAGLNNVTFPSGTWTDDISHGELIRDGYDETMTLRPCNMQFLYQGVDPTKANVDYNLIPWQLGLLTQTN